MDIVHESLTQSARYANFILPQLRKLAGFEDSGTGTYGEGDEENYYNLEEMYDEFFEGFMEGFREGYKEVRGRDEHSGDVYKR